MDQYIGKMLDNRYEILECIGTGGMAVVYKARCHRLNRLVAVKILKPELAKDADFRRRFHDESQAVAMLSNANIVSVYDVSHSDGLDYIVMELIDGMTLKQYMQKRGTPLNWREALHFITQILRALSHAHSRGIIHRDIKPQNILVLRDGSVKVTDFGIAQLANAAQSTLTQEALGSVHYISPEQAKGSHVDGRSDLYSAGVVLYEMLTGRLPFEGETPVFVAIQHINSIPIAPRELNPEIPEALEAITMKAMAPNLNQRYASADEMLADLKEFRKNPDAPVPTPADPEEMLDEPTMVVPIPEITTAAKQTAEHHPKQGGSGDDAPPAEPRRRSGAQEGYRSGKDEEDPSSRRRSNRQDPEEDDMLDDPPRRRSVPPILFAILAILIFVGGLIYFLYSFFFQGLFSTSEEYRVPDLRGYTMEELEQNPAIKGEFEVVVGSTVFNTEYEEGKICDQTPAANETVKEGGLTITVTISGGEDEMFMPDVTGWDAREALKLLQNDMHLNVKQEYEYSPTVTENFVITYTPMQDTRLYEGDEVTIVISKGPEQIPVTVTSFIGVSIDQVRSQLDLLGLKFGTADSVYSDEYPDGRVVWQSIPNGTEVEKGTTINFQVSMGPEPEPSVEVSPEPAESDTIVPPTEDVGAVPSTQTISVDLSGYTGNVMVRIVVGSTTAFDGMVDAGSVQTFSREVTGTGVQQVNIYINDKLAYSYSLYF